MSLKPEVYIKNDYAGIGNKNFTAYYGYEETIGEGDDEEWCFKAEFNDEVIIIPFSKLGCSDMFNVGICLMTGIAWLFAKYKLTL